MSQLVTPWNDSQATTYLNNILPALKSHLEEKRWTSRFYFRAADEPSSCNEINAANWLYGKYRSTFGSAANTNQAQAYLCHWRGGLLVDLTRPSPTIQRRTSAHVACGRHPLAGTANIQHSISRSAPMAMTCGLHVTYAPIEWQHESIYRLLPERDPTSTVASVASRSHRLSALGVE
jgi:hypothetical protein